MKFLLDHDVPDDVSYSLESLGHEVVKLREVLPGVALCRERKPLIK